MSDDTRQHQEALTPAQHTINGFRMVLQGIPLGAVLEKAIFGVLDERRMNRVLQTLVELVERVERLERPVYVDSEQFLSLLESVLPVLARATQETKRRCLRDLLLHGATTPPDSPDWGEAELAARMIAEIDAPGLALLSATGLLAADEVIVWYLPAPTAHAITRGQEALQPAFSDSGVAIPYTRVVLRWAIQAEV